MTLIERSRLTSVPGWSMREGAIATGRRVRANKMEQVTKQAEFREGGYTYGIKEVLLSPDIRPFYLGFVAFSASGKVAWQFPQTRISYRIEPEDREARILDVVVPSQHERQGIGRRLVEIAERRFREHGITKVAGYANPEVHAFWRKLGYQILPTNDILKQL